MSLDSTSHGQIDEHISHLMQCKPLTEQEVLSISFFPLISPVFRWKNSIFCLHCSESVLDLIFDRLNYPIRCKSTRFLILDEDGSVFILPFRVLFVFRCDLNVSICRFVISVEIRFGDVIWLVEFHQI